MGQFLLTVIKFFLAILLLPVAIASFASLHSHLGNLPDIFLDFFLYGSGAFFVTFLFIYQFWGVYEIGQGIINSLVKFTAPLDRLITNIIPFYFVVVMLSFYVSVHFFEKNNLVQYFMFFAGFFFAMHILLTAQDLQEDEKTPVKPTYYFKMMLVTILNVFWVVLFLDLIIGRFSFPGFFNAMLLVARFIYMSSFEKILFLS